MRKELLEKGGGGEEALGVAGPKKHSTMQIFFNMVKVL
jgi:hypothetical protein